MTQTIVDDFLASLMHEDSSTSVNTNAAIVAIPRDLDPIRLIGDEEKHATLLFFGETSSLPEDAKTTLVNTLQQAAQMFSPFGESIIDVSRLGSDNPPALVAKLSGRNLSQIRDVLQINPKFGEYMSNGTQHPSYMPHVTLGYPDYIGEALLRESVRQLGRVQFDRLALWWNDERIEFPLGVNLDMGPDGDLMTEPQAADAYMNHVGMGGQSLEHHGVKGMKWGVRKDGSGGSGGFRGKKKGPQSPPSEDAAKAAQAKAKIKAGGTQSLSNQELQALVTRMNLERNYANLSSSQKKTLAGTAGKIVGRFIQQQAQQYAQNYVQKKVIPDVLGMIKNG